MEDGMGALECFRIAQTLLIENHHQRLVVGTDDYPPFQYTHPRFTLLWPSRNYDVWTSTSALPGTSFVLLPFGLLISPSS
jgi:hypothetical protein